MYVTKVTEKKLIILLIALFIPKFIILRFKIIKQQKIMRRIIIIFGLLLATITITAQDIADNTIGVRISNYYSEIAYQKKISENSRLEANLGWRGYYAYSDIKLTGLYQYVMDFQPLDGMNMYFGGGGAVGTWSYKSRYYYSYYDYEDKGVFFSGIGNFGVEYKFKFPLLVSADARPGFEFSKFNSHSGFLFDFGISARYTFN